MGVRTTEVEKALYSKALLDSIHIGASSPFIPIYAVQLGATPLQVSLIYALSNFNLNLFQIFWGYISDRIGKKALFIIVGSISSSILLIPILLTSSPTILIILVTLHSIAISMTIPTFISYSAEVIEEQRIRIFSGRINSLMYIGWVTATLTIGITSEIGLNGFVAGLILALISGLIGVIIFSINCREVESDPPRVKRDYRQRSLLVEVKSHDHLIQFIITSSSFSVFLSLSWPLFTITQTKIALLTFFEISLLEVASGASGAICLFLLLRWISKIGLQKLLIISSSSLAIIPLFYGLTPEFLSLLLIHLISGIVSSIYDTSVFSYILEKTPMKEKGLCTALYNFATGTALFTGPILSGLLLEHLTSTFSLSEALLYLYLTSTIGRFLTGLLYYYIKILD
ncbi:MAG: MFS transporter [Aigarchaeota archaeon]|nr:MFS transporter [Aigarchaeota archaeon]MCX8192827.1 MFS transporter [Nitrososphaeria archaeon]MDW7986071.1 MFS transporter [Nitrososphaerota archaeon]